MLAEQVEGALYEWREQTAAVRVPGEPEERLAAVLALAEAIRDGEAAQARGRRGEPERLSERPPSGAFDYAARSVGRSSAKGGKSAGLQRLALLVFGALFVLLFVVFAIAQGIGQPSVPSGDVAVVEDAPDGLGTVSEAQFKHALVQAAAEDKSSRCPNRATKNTKRLQETALGELLDCDLDPGSGRRNGHLGDAERNRRRTRKN